MIGDLFAFLLAVILGAFLLYAAGWALVRVWWLIRGYE